VRALTAVNFTIVIGKIAYAHRVGIPLVLTALLSAVPVALPATFTLASALGAPLQDGYDEADVPAFAAAVGSAEGQDAIDLAIRSAAPRKSPTVTRFIQFDPATKMPEGILATRRWRAVGGGPGRDRRPIPTHGVVRSLTISPLHCACSSCRIA
jgi:H+-transporting ATPase